MLRDLWNRFDNPLVRSVGIATHDYFMRESRYWTQVRIESVEKFHLSDSTFWRDYYLGHYDAGRQELKFILSHVPNHPAALYLLGVLSIKMHDVSQPLQWYERAMRLFPEHAYTRAQYGRYLVDIGNVETGILELEQATRDEPDLAIARAWLDEAYQRRAQLTPPSH